LVDIKTPFPNPLSKEPLLRDTLLAATATATVAITYVTPSGEEERFTREEQRFTRVSAEMVHLSVWQRVVPENTPSLPGLYS
jgi:hypothetical protein